MIMISTMIMIVTSKDPIPAINTSVARKNIVNMMNQNTLICIITKMMTLLMMMMMMMIMMMMMMMMMLPVGSRPAVEIQ